MEIGELGNTLAADVLKFWMDSENRMLINHQVEQDQGTYSRTNLS